MEDKVIPGYWYIYQNPNKWKGDKMFVRSMGRYDYVSYRDPGRNSKNLKADFENYRPFKEGWVIDNEFVVDTVLKKYCEETC